MKVRNIILSTFAAGLVMTAGCAETDNDANRAMNGDNEFDQFEGSRETNDEMNARLGYVRYKKDEMDMDIEEQHVVTIDRDRMADMISRLILRNDGFEEVATLVTDDEVLIAYQKPDDMDRERAATIVKKTGLSTLPRFYDVYVSDQPVSFRDIQSLQNSTTMNDDYENTLDFIINEMKKAPQGENIDDDYNKQMENQEG